MSIEVSDSDVLLVIDVQNDFCPGGALAVPDGNDVVAVANKVAVKFAHVVLTQDWHPPGHSSFASVHPGRSALELIEMDYGDQVLWPDHCVQGTTGAEFHPGLQELPSFHWRFLFFSRMRTVMPVKTSSRPSK